MGQKFARLGLLDGRAERMAGTWSTRSPEQIIKLVWDNWR
jgi:hypothetical protein